MNERKQEPDECHAFPSVAEHDLSATIQEALEDVLLKESPEWDQQEPPAHIGKIETRDKDDQRDRYGRRREQEFRGSEEVVKTEAEVVCSFFVDAMREDDQREGEGDRNGEHEFVRADKRQDHPLSDQTRDND
jgi:hypothetical protein